MQLGPNAKKDFFYYLLNAKDAETGKGFTTKELWGEANVLMIAGSDTTATALSSTLFHLCKTPSALSKLQSELYAAFPTASSITPGKPLSDCHYLKACIDEAMRMAPPVPGLLPREVITPCTIDGLEIPAGTIIGVPIFGIHHNPAYFPDPFTYTPERWLHDSDEEALERALSAFNPFSIGARGCIGKSVAYMELRLAIAKLVWGFDVKALPTEGKAELWREAFHPVVGGYRLMDHFTCKKEGPVVEFSETRQPVMAAA